MLVEAWVHPAPMRNEVGAVGARFQKRELATFDKAELMRQLAMYSS